MQITGSATNIALSITGSVIAMPQMASSLTGSFTGSVGNVWFNTDTNKMQYTSGSFVVNI